MEKKTYEELEAENDKLTSLAFDIEFIEKADFTDMNIRGPMGDFFAVTMINLFKGFGATNFLTMGGQAKDGVKYSVTIQKEGGDIPADKIGRLEKIIKNTLKAVEDSGDSEIIYTFGRLLRGEDI